MPLDGHIDILSGFAFDSAKFSTTGEVPIIRIRDVVRGRSETYFTGDYDPRYLVAEGDLLIGMDGDFNRATWQSGPALLNQRVCKVTANPETLDQRYLYHFLPIGLRKIWESTSFATVKHLSVKGIRGINIPLPCLDKQRRIAAILDKTDELRDKRREALAHLDTLTQSIFYEMFGHPISNPMKWPVGRISDLLESAKYGTSSKASDHGEFPVLRMNNISYSGQLVLDDLKYMDLAESVYDKYLVRTGDVLFNRTNSAELVGKTALVRSNTPMAFAGYLVRLRTRSSTAPEYLAAFMNLPPTKQTLRNMCKSIVGMANINAKEVQTIRIPVPPFSLQGQFASRIAAVERLKEHHRAQLTELDALFASLQHRAFKGEL
ncbi:restriction endonuclease subunit S [Arthrobacter subterraneus]|uniref:restriction endonuclease subunit S n=1 Tax=Arthrobacter subterraneus TaxID=335973 RepID=UPI00380392B7